MTTRDEFEKWIEERTDLGAYLKREKSPSGNEFYRDDGTHYAYLAWEARQQEIDALKAEIERLKAVTILPALPRPQVPRVDADLDLMDIRTLVRWCERIAVNYATASIEHDRATHTLPSRYSERAPSDHIADTSTLR